MTRAQLNAAIASLLERTQSTLKTCEGATAAEYGQNVWTANMAASLVLGALTDALIEVRDQTPYEPTPAPQLKLFNPDDSTVES